MIRCCMAIRLLLVTVFLAGVAGGVPSARGQDKSVRPGINDSFAKPDVGQFIERFEKEGREIYDRREQIVATCNLRPGLAVADIGAGTGLFTRLFAEKVGPQGRVYAVDIAQQFLDHITKSCQEQRLGNVVGILCTATSTALPPDSVDVAFICDTYHHFEFPQKTMNSLAAAVRPGGDLYLIDFVRIEGQSSEWVLSHVRAGQEVFRQEVEAAGFEFVAEKKLLEQNYFLHFRKTGAQPPAKSGS